MALLRALAAKHFSRLRRLQSADHGGWCLALGVLSRRIPVSMADTLRASPKKAAASPRELGLAEARRELRLFRNSSLFNSNVFFENLRISWGGA
jgi:hypothetical protein